MGDAASGEGGTQSEVAHIALRSERDVPADICGRAAHARKSQPQLERILHGQMGR